MTDEVWIKNQPPKKRIPKRIPKPPAANFMHSIMNNFVGGKE